MTKQEQIYNFLLKTKENVSSDEAKNKLKAKTSIPNAYVIGKEIDTTKEDKYFEIYFEEVRTDELFIQITPMICFRSKYLKVDKSGSLSLTDNYFKPYQSSKDISFAKGILALEDNNLIDRERVSSKCIKGLISLGVFAMAASTIYLASKDERNDNTATI